MARKKTLYKGGGAKSRGFFVKVTPSDYYGRYDGIVGPFAPGEPPVLEAFKIKHGMRIKVKWKNGVVTTERLTVRLGEDAEQIDMSGGPDHFKTRDFVVVRTINGAKVDVPLRGLHIARIGGTRGR